MSEWLVERLAALEQRVAELERRSEDGTPAGGRARRLAPGWEPRLDDLAWAKEKFPRCR